MNCYGKRNRPSCCKRGSTGDYSANQQLYKTAYLYVKNEEDALDIVQDSMIKIIQRIQTLKEPNYFGTWAIRIVIFCALDFLKKKRPEGLPEEFATPTNPLSYEEHLDIADALKKLPEHLRQVTILYYFHGRRVREIAEIFGEPQGTVKYKLYEARAILKDYLKEGTGDGIE